jgi:predicted TIM-barrel fold metal-dependent hydrolase
VPAYAWRLDAAYRKLHKEVPHLQKLPSEYLREHFWMSTQPMEEPDSPEWVEDVYWAFQQAMGEKLMYSSDYPHWDFDAPDALWDTLPFESRRKILGETASEFFNIPLLEGHGLTPEEAGARAY